jgi:hypothetical protein
MPRPDVPNQSTSRYPSSTDQKRATEQLVTRQAQLLILFNKSEPPPIGEIRKSTNGDFHKDGLTESRRRIHRMGAPARSGSIDSGTLGGKVERKPTVPHRFEEPADKNP